MRARDRARDSRVKLRVLPKVPRERAAAATPHGIWERQNEAQTSRNPRDGRLGDSIVRDPPAIRPKAGRNPQNVQSGQPGEHVDPRGGDVFNNLVMFDQHVPQNSLTSIVPDLATDWSWNE